MAMAQARSRYTATSSLYVQLPLMAILILRSKYNAGRELPRKAHRPRSPFDGTPTLPTDLIPLYPYHDLTSQKANSGPNTNGCQVRIHQLPSHSREARPICVYMCVYSVLTSTPYTVLHHHCQVRLLGRQTRRVWQGDRRYAHVAQDRKRAHGA